MPRLSAPNLQLPWSSSLDDDKRFWRILLWVLLPFLLLGLLIPFIKVPEPDREQLERLPPHLARVVVEQTPPPPPPVVELPRPVEVPPEPERVPEPQPEPERRVTEPEPTPPPPREPDPARVQQAREQARRSGVLEFADDLASMRQAAQALDLNRSDSRPAVREPTEVARVERDLLSDRARTQSGGVDTSALSRDTGGVALSGRETTAVESQLETVSAAAQEARAAPQRERGYRSEQAIRQQMDAARGRIFGIYNRALRANPTLQGTVEFRLVIEPDGEVSAAEVIRSELNDPDLERRLLAAIRFIDFGVESVLQTTLNYSFDFLPY